VSVFRPTQATPRNARSLLSEDPEGAGAGPVEREVVELAAVVIVEGERAVADIDEVIAADAVAGIALGVDRGEGATGVAQDPEGAAARPVEREVVELAAVVTGRARGGSSWPLCSTAQCPGDKC
jgi:hypothetical protein